MGRPKKERPEDPLARVREGQALATIPTLRRTARPLDGEVLSAAITMASGVRRIQALQRQIDGLNDLKSHVYAQMRTLGFDTATVKKLIREQATDPAVREHREMLLDLYARALDQAASQADESLFDAEFSLIEDGSEQAA